MKCARGAFRRSRWVLGLAALLTALAGLAASRLEIRLNIQSLLPERLPALQEFRESVEDFGSEDLMVVAVDAPASTNLESYRPFIKKFKERLAELPEIRGGQGTISKKLFRQVETYIEKFGLFLLPLESLADLNAQLAPEQIEEQLGRYKTLDAVPVSQRGFDPLGVVHRAYEHFFPARQIQPDASGEYFLTRDHGTALFLLRLSGSSGNPKITRAFLKGAKAIEAELRQDPSLKLASDPALGPQVTMVGRPIVLVEDQAVLKQALWTNILGSLLGVTVLFFLFFRGLRPLIISYLPLGVGVVMTFGLAFCFYGSLNAITIGLGGMLIGLGIDFPTYLLNRYYQERRDGKEPLVALEVTWKETGSSVCYGAFTTAAAFLLLLAADFAAFRQLGLLAGLGLLLTMGAVLILTPALLAEMERDRLPKPLRLYPYVLARAPLRFPRAFALGSLVLLVVCAGYAARIRLETPLREMTVLAHSVTNVSLKKMQAMSKKLGLSLIPFRVLVKEKSWEEALKSNERLQSALLRLKGAGTIAFFDSLALWLPSQERQARTLSDLTNLPNLDSGKFSRHYAQGVSGGMFASLLRPLTMHGPYRKQIEKLLSGREPTDREKMLSHGLGSILDTYAREKPEGIALITNVYLPHSDDYVGAKETALQALRQEPLFVEGRARYPSAEGVMAEVNLRIREETLWFGLAILGVIVAVLAWNFRSLKWTLLALTPMLLAAIAVVGSYTLLFGAISTMNFLWLPMFFGMATDDALHLMNHWRESKGTLESALRQTGGAITLTSLTTIVGFGSMALGPFPIMQQAGILVALAMFWELLASLYLLPALMRIFLRRGDLALGNRD